MVDRFFLPAGTLVGVGHVELDEEESRHAVHARRVRAGDEVELLDGDGGVGRGRVARATKRGLEVDIGDVMRRARGGRRVELALSVPRGARMETLVDVATQLGVAAIAPVAFARSVAARDEVSEHKIERWHRIAREACKQSGSPFVPEWLPLETLDAWIARTAATARVALHPGDRAEPLAARLAADGGNISILIGPEGGLEPRETERLREAGVPLATLGAEILRIEAAAIVAASLARYGRGE